MKVLAFVFIAVVALIGGLASVLGFHFCADEAMLILQPTLNAASPSTGLFSYVKQFIRPGRKTCACHPSETEEELADFVLEGLEPSKSRA